MQNHIDVQGASGTSYRFRIWPADGEHAPMPGNFVFVRMEPGAWTVVYSGEVHDLSTAPANWAEARDAHGATHIYTRLNVSGAIRREEHADIVARWRPPMNG